jgi:general secretion pathway protein E
MKRLGEILSETCGLSEEVLSEALRIQEEKGGRIGEILIQQKAISEADLLQALSIQFGLKFSSTLPAEDLNTEFTEQVPIQFLKKYMMVPVSAWMGPKLCLHPIHLFFLPSILHMTWADIRQRRSSKI